MCGCSLPTDPRKGRQPALGGSGRAPLTASASASTPNQDPDFTLASMTAFLIILSHILTVALGSLFSVPTTNSAHAVVY